MIDFLTLEETHKEDQRLLEGKKLLKLFSYIKEEEKNFLARLICSKSHVIITTAIVGKNFLQPKGKVV